MSALPTLEGLWTAEDVAEFLKVSRKTVYNWAEAGTLPYRKLGALLRFVPADIRAWVDGRLTAGTRWTLSR